MSESADLARKIADKAQELAARAERLDQIEYAESAALMALSEQALSACDEAALRQAFETISDPRATQWLTEILDFLCEIVPVQDADTGAVLRSSLVAIPVVFAHACEIDARLDEERREWIEEFLRDEGFLGEEGEICIEPYLYGREDLEIPAMRRRLWLLQITDGAWGSMAGEPSPEPGQLTCPAPEGRTLAVSLRFVVGALFAWDDAVELLEAREGAFDLVDEGLAPAFAEQEVEAKVLPPSLATQSIAPAAEAAQMIRLALAARGACEQAREVWAEIRALPSRVEFNVTMNAPDGRVLETLVWRAETIAGEEESMERLTKTLELSGVREVRWPKVPRH